MHQQPRSRRGARRPRGRHQPPPGVLLRLMMFVSGAEGGRRLLEKRIERVEVTEIPATAAQESVAAAAHEASVDESLRPGIVAKRFGKVVGQGKIGGQLIHSGGRFGKTGRLTPRLVVVRRHRSTLVSVRVVFHPATSTILPIDAGYAWFPRHSHS
jgi:hypothetical protein